MKNCCKSRHFYNLSALFETQPDRLFSGGGGTKARLTGELLRTFGGKCSSKVPPLMTFTFFNVSREKIGAFAWRNFSLKKNKTHKYQFIGKSIENFEIFLKQSIYQT